MIISEVIKELTELKNKFGDVKCVHTDGINFDKKLVLNEGEFSNDGRCMKVVYFFGVSDILIKKGCSVGYTEGPISFVELNQSNDWYKLTEQEKSFVFRARKSRGGKYNCEPHSYNDIALWEKPEQLGFIECTGSYKWIVTEKFNSLVVSGET